MVVSTRDVERYWHMSARQRLRQLIDQQQDRLRMIASDRDAAVIALLRVRERQASTADQAEPASHLVTGRRLGDPGGNKALWLCLEAFETGNATPPGFDMPIDHWAERFTLECARLTETDMVLTHCETGFMQLDGADDGSFDAWITTKLMPASWREREDIDWWARWLAGRNAAGMGSERTVPRDPIRFADVYLNRMQCQFGLPDDAEIGGCTVGTCRQVLGCLIERALRARDSGEEVSVRIKRDLIDEIAAELSIDLDAATGAVAAFTVDAGSAAWHAAVPGVAAAPIVRVGQDRLALSLHGLTSEPLFFLTRELRRRNTQDYHNAAHLREDVFRADLFELFQDKRFVTSPNRIKLRRAEGDIRTDIDAAVFDRKTGTLGLFELKSQDPFARSTEGLIRQRDNMLYANRQVSGVLTWLNRHGGDEILRRIDNRVARKFRVQKVYPFVLGRYLAHFNDGPEPDRRAAWGTWPQVLHLLDEQPERGAKSNPIASLYTMLTKDSPLSREPVEFDPHEIALGEVRITVYPSFAAFRNREPDTRQGCPTGAGTDDAALSSGMV